MTHNHAVGIAGAQAVYTLPKPVNRNKKYRNSLRLNFGYELSRKLDDIQVSYSFDIYCAGSAPELILAFIESGSFESDIRLASSLGGDADTMACIASAIAEPFYGGVPEILQQTTRKYLDDHLLGVIVAFCSKYVYEPRISN